MEKIREILETNANLHGGLCWGPQLLPAPPSVRREGAAAPVFFSLKTFTALQKRDRISRNRPRNRSICPGAHSLLSLSALAPIFCQDHSPPPSAHALVFPLAPTKTTTSFQDVCVCVCVCAPFNLFLRLVGALTDSSVSLVFHSFSWHWLAVFFSSSSSSSSSFSRGWWWWWWCRWLWEAFSDQTLASVCPFSRAVD